MARQSYRVKRPLHHGEGKDAPERFAPGDYIELDDAHAKRLLASGAIEMVAPPKADKTRRGEG